MSSYTVYGRPGCAFCFYAQKTLDQLNADYEYIDIYAEGLSKEDVSLKINQPVATMPQILHGETYIGGYTELVSYLKAQNI